MTKEFFMSKKGKIIFTILFMVISIGVSFIITNSNVNEWIIEVLDKKKMDVLLVSGGTTSFAVIASALPGELANPIADILTNIASYCLIITCIIFLEKFLLSSLGVISFAIIIPVGCLLSIIYILYENEKFKKLSTKIIAFGLVIYLIIPFGTCVSLLVEKTFDDQYNSTISKVDELKNSKKEISGIKNYTEKAKKFIETQINKCVDALAVLIITACLIPLASMAFMLWFTKTLFGLNVNFKIPSSVSKTIKFTGKSIVTAAKSIKEKDVPKIEK